MVLTDGRSGMFYIVQSILKDEDQFCIAFDFCLDGMLGESMYSFTGGDFGGAKLIKLIGIDGRGSRNCKGRESQSGQRKESGPHCCVVEMGIREQIPGF